MSLRLLQWIHSINHPAVREKISFDDDLLKTLLDIAQREVLANPWKVMEETKYGILMENKSEETLLGLSISTDMATYKELLEILPEIKQYIK